MKGILLFGPPGTGKTLIARQIGKLLNGREPKVRCLFSSFVSAQCLGLFLVVKPSPQKKVAEQYFEFRVVYLALINYSLCCIPFLSLRASGGNIGFMPTYCSCNHRLSMALKFSASSSERLRRMYETYLQMPKLSKSHGVIFYSFEMRW